MERGYAIVQKADGSFVKRSEQVEMGERVRVRLAAGVLECEIFEKETPS
jgi:exonuclease VII large subunit